ncbi:MAG: hypothetical protein LBC75_13845 [Fibromonadaceae bacterium]|jgi:uncharacterized protein (TIGR02145 family)|nr:hypothetical protein [Fibromonadaceae bacterium]
MEKLMAISLTLPVFTMAQEVPQQPSALSTFMHILLIFILIYVFFILPKQKKQKPEQTDSFTQKKGTFTDPRDGKTYKTVKIGNQTWMAENLEYKESLSQCNDQKYGRLYYWKTAKEVSPPGWHLPSRVEWMTLVNLAGSLNKLKATSGWNNNGNGTDNYGFSALPGGCTFFSEPHCIGDVGYWWTSDDNINNDNTGLFISFANEGCNYWDKADKCSVRCVQD